VELWGGRGALGENGGTDGGAPRWSLAVVLCMTMVEQGRAQFRYPD
jgi:hypothetical protein